MTTYALDMNVIIDFLRGNENIIKNMSNAYANSHVLALPIIVYYEVALGFIGNGAFKQLKKFLELCEILEPLYFDRYNMKVINNALKIYENLRKKSALIEDNDIFIAAAAIANGATLVTDNVKHFEMVEGLTVVNWKE